MNRRMSVAILFVLAVSAASLTFGMRGLAQPAPQMPMAPAMRQPMPMSPPATGQQTTQMMLQMEATIKKLRTQLNKVNPSVLTAQQRPIYEYLKLLQAHLETMAPMMRMMQGLTHDTMMQSMMMQMMGQQMPMNQPRTREQMMQQMHGQMAQMEATVKALRAQLNKVNPDLLTGQERLIHEYLKMLQTHLETVAPMMQTMPGMMQNTMPGPMMPMPGTGR